MKTAIVGYTGFVGSNLCRSHKFDSLYNSKNVKEAYGSRPDLLLYSGIPAEMFLANKFPEKDREVIGQAIENIKRINPKNVVLISTISVYKNPVEVNEDTPIEINGLSHYGINRKILENWVSENYSEALIVRLPALYGKGIKKNFIYDMIHYIPTMLNPNTFRELSIRNRIIEEYYFLDNTGFYKCRDLSIDENKRLKTHFQSLSFSALNFTDSRANFQFYNLRFLWGHINTALEQSINFLNLNSEPINAAELYQYVTDECFVNEITDSYPTQNMKTIHFDKFGGKDGYLMDKNFILDDIKSFILNEKEAIQ
jgi:hypothetical protein